jgi:hydrazine synthase alpha subunit-like protein
MMKFGKICQALTLLLAAVQPAGAQTSAQLPKPLPTPLPYDLVYVRGPRFGDNQNTTWPEIFHPAEMDPGADLMLLHPDGSEEVLVDCTKCSVVDPVISFDAQWVYYSLFPDMTPAGINSQRGLPYQGSDIYRMHLASRRVERLTHGEFTPNTGAGAWCKDPATGRYDPLAQDSQCTSLGYGILNTGPCPLPGGKIMFTSNRNGFAPPKSYTNPMLQLFVMDEDGKNVEMVGHLNLGSALHPTVLTDGRVMFSSYESQGIRDIRLWGLWAVWPDGRVFEPLMSAFFDPQAFHFQTQLSDDQIVVVDYYNLNNNGFGTLYKFPAKPPAGQPPFGSWRPDDDSNPPLKQGVFYNGLDRNAKMAFEPKGISVVTPFTTGQDEAAPPYTPGDNDGPYMGKFTHPSGAPDNDLLVVWSPGPANDLNRPTPEPYYDAGLYLIRNGGPVQSPAELFLIKNDPAYNEQWPRAVVRYSAVHPGFNEPVNLPWLPNDGTLSPELPEGTPFGLVGTSSLYKRDSFPGTKAYPPDPDPYDGLDVFNTSQNDESSNWTYQGADDGKYSNSDIYAIRILAMEPSSHRSYGAHGGCCGAHRQFSNHATEKLRILGEVPVRKPDVGGQPVLDPDGNPDTSFLVKIPADTPFTFQMLDKDGLVLTMAQTWHQVRPGEIRNNCGGCHAHSQMPTLFEQTAAAKPGYVVRDLAHNTPLLSADQSGQTILEENPGVRAVDVEYKRDIRPVLQRSCVPCHSKQNSSPAAQLVLDDDVLDPDDGLPGTYRRLADDQAAKFGIKPVISFGPYWRQSNASRYVRMFQSRRSLLVWKVFGRRLDGWTNASHPTEAVPGNPAGLTDAERNLADLDYTGTIMPPPNSGAPALSADEKRNFARWVDLGCPIDMTEPGPVNWGWFVDDLRPTLTVSAPRAGFSRQALTRIRIGAFDYYSGLQMAGGRPATLSVKADFAIDGHLPGDELASLFQPVSSADGVVQMTLAQPILALSAGKLVVTVTDQRGNETRVERSFGIQAPGAPVSAPELAWMLVPSALALGLAARRQNRVFKA